MNNKSSHSVKISLVIPVYCSEHILPRLIEDISNAMSEAGLEGSFELILVNDGSRDQSWLRIKELTKKCQFIVGLCLMRNFGQHNAIMAGLNYARGEIIVILDDDLQHPPAEIPRLLNAIESGADVCYVRYRNRQHPLWKKIGSWFNDLAATLLLGKPRGLYLSSFKALRRPIVAELIKYDGPFTYVDGLILDVTRSIQSIEIVHQPRYAGDGNYTLRRSISLWIKMATSFSIFPLRVASLAGVTLAILSAILSIGIVARKFIHPETPVGWTSLAAIILFVGGTQLACIGLIGEYLGRAYLVINKKPQFVIREVVTSRL